MKLTCNSPKGMIRLYAVAVSALALLCTVLRYLSLAFFFEKEMGYFKTGAVLPMVQNVLLAVCAIAILVFSILKFRRVPVEYGARNTRSVRIFSGVAALLSLLYPVLSLMNKEMEVSRWLLVFSMISAIYFLFHAGAEKAPDLPRFLTGIGVILFLLFSLWRAYSDITVAMNAPDKLLFMIGCLFAMFFTVEELRVLFGATRSVLYFISIGGSVLFLSVATLPTLFASLLGQMEAPSWILSHLILVGMLLYTSVRMIFLTRDLPKQAEEQTAAATEPDAESEAEEIPEDMSDKEEPKA